MKMLLMGNQAIAHAAIEAGAGLISGYPGTPSTEIIETAAKIAQKGVHVEWSVNEKAALEVAAGASYTGMRTMVTMKQVGLNVASDPLMSLAYVGVKGGMVVVVADDPGPISSQTEQDTRTFAAYSKLPVLDPATPAEAYEMVGKAFELSEKYNTPVLLRPTTRVCHACEAIEVTGERREVSIEGFVKDNKWVIFPKLSHENHKKIEERNLALTSVMSAYEKNQYIPGESRIGVAAGGVSYAYLLEALKNIDVSVPVLKVATPFPFPYELAGELLTGVDSVIVFEELDPVIERALIATCGRNRLFVEIRGKLSGDTPRAGELSADIIEDCLVSCLGLERGQREADAPKMPPLAVRPPVLCAGCPHRASFYAVKRAMKGKKSVFCGDIGCYTLGNAMPLDMVDTCLCMGAGITIAQGIKRAEPGTKAFAFIGDSTFFASGMTGVANAVYNGSDIVLCVLDNGTTAMTGHQENPITGIRADKSRGTPLSIDNILRALGVGFVETINPFEQELAQKTVLAAAEYEGVSAVIFKSPCAVVTKGDTPYMVDEDRCIGCRMCIDQLGCPSIFMADDKAKIDRDTCHGCGLCAYICPVGAIKREEGR